MAVVESFVEVGGTDAVLDTTLVTQEDGTEADREGVFIGDPETTAARAKVKNEPISSDDYALAVRQPANANARTHEILDNILLEMKLLNARFEEAFDTAINKGDVK
jgi:hypothetical protein